MLYEAGYNIIELYSATKGMDQSISSQLLKPEYSYYIENIMPSSLGEGKVRYGTSFIADVTDTIIEAFPFETEEGTSQMVLYFNGYEQIVNYSNLAVLDSNNIVLTSPDWEKFKEDTYLSLRYNTPTGLTQFLYFRILSIEDEEHDDTIIIEVDQNSFPDNLANFFINQPTDEITYLADNAIHLVVPEDFIASLFYYPGQQIHLQVDDKSYSLTISSFDNSIPDLLVLFFNEHEIDPFGGAAVTTLAYESLFPQITTLYNSVGYIKVMDMDSLDLLPGGNQTLSNLSVACVPRAEFFANVLWIYNGVDPVMVWDGEELSIYEEPVKEFANSFIRVDGTHFSFVSNAAFEISKYQNGNTIQLSINGNLFETTCVNVINNAGIITITTADAIPAFTGQDRIELFYMDKPPKFSTMKSAHSRLWCLGEGAVGLDYRKPQETLRVYYSYTTFTDDAPFRFFNENTKTVPSENISPKHGGADNLEAIVNISGHLAFIGRQKTQIWSGSDPLTIGEPDSLSWSSTIPVGVYHGNLVIELPNDAYFVSQNGILSFGTLNIARQFAASPTANMDKLVLEYLDTINSNFDYRACRAFKYSNGAFCSFKIGFNNLITAKYNTSLYWWGIFSGDFTRSNTFLSTLDNSLYLFIDNKIYRYADGIIGAHIYGDNGGTSYINFIETKYVNSNRNRYSNKRYEIQSEYSSNIVINKENVVSVIVRGDLVDSFTLQNIYNLKQKGDVLGTVNLVNGNGLDPNYPDNALLGMRLDSPTHTKKGRLKFLSSNFSVSLVGQTKDGPFSLKKIKLFGIKER